MATCPEMADRLAVTRQRPLLVVDDANLRGEAGETSLQRLSQPLLRR